jgi:hypothetical protein
MAFKTPPYAEAQAGLLVRKRHSGITKIAGKHTPPYASLQAGYAGGLSLVKIQYSIY